MRALVVYESIHGNTAKVASAVSAGLADRMAVVMAEAQWAPLCVPANVDLLVVGGLTHAFGLSSAAAEPGAIWGPVSRACGVRAWLSVVEFDSPEFAAASFDIRSEARRLPGSAAAAAQRRLKRLGARLLVPPESFRLSGRVGPVTEDELLRAESWAHELARMLGDAAHSAATG